MDNQILINRYLNSLKQSGKSILTLSAYATDLKQFSAAIGPTPLAHLTSPKLTRLQTPPPASLREALRAGGASATGGQATNNQQLITRFSPNSRARKLTTIREFLKWCFSKGYLKKDLSKDIKAVRRITVSPTKPLSASQLYRLRSKADVKERLILELIISSNLKLSSIVKLKMKDVSLPSSIIHHSSFISQSLEYYLAQYPRGPKSYLLTNKFNRPMSVRTLSSILKNLSRRAGVKHGTFRNLRETSKT